MKKFTTVLIKRLAKLLLVWLAFLGFNNKVTAQVTNLKGLLILIDFSDSPADVTLSRADKIINGVGYTEATVTASLRDYWYKQSRGKINLTHDVVGYFRAPNTAAWYKNQPWTEFLTLSKAALEWFKSTNPGYNWNSLSLSNDPGEVGTFLSVNFFTTEWICGSGGTHAMTWTAPNGKKTQQITAQMFMAKQWDKNINLFWITHEQGHSVWGVPDTYDHNNNSRGDGNYSVMGGNMSNGQIEAFGTPFIVQKGWVTVVDIAPNQSYTLTQDGNTVARFKNPSNPKEYFLIEARMKSTLGNEMIPTTRGLLIWHVDENVTTNNDKPNMTAADHYMYSVEQADGKFDLEKNVNSFDGGDMFVVGKTFSNTTTPNTKWWNSSSSGLNINNIQFLPNNQISFCNGTCSTSIDVNDLSAPSLNFYPNPNNGEFTLEVGFLDNGNYNLEIVNLLGQVVYHEALNINNTNYNYTKKFSLTEVPKGIYIVKLNNNNGTEKNKKISIE